MAKASNSRVKVLYDLFAPVYDWEAITTGFSENSPWRKRAIDALHLTSTSSVLDVACGTGLNFRCLESYLDETRGRIVGVDLSSRMLGVAERRIRRRQWSNIELVNMDITSYQPSTRFDAAISTLAMETMPNYSAVVDDIFAMLKPHGRFAMIGMKPSSRLPFKLLNRLCIWFAKSGGIDVRRDVATYVRSKHAEIDYQEFWGGFCYVLSASKSEQG